MRASERKGSLPNFQVGDYVMVASVRKPGVLPKLVSTWTGPWRVPSRTGGKHGNGVEDIVTGQRKDVNVARMIPYVDQSLDINTELQEVVIEGLSISKDNSQWRPFVWLRLVWIMRNGLCR